MASELEVGPVIVSSPTVGDTVVPTGLSNAIREPNNPVWLLFMQWTCVIIFFEVLILVQYIPWSDENIWRYSVVSLLNDIQISWRHFSERND